MEFSSAPGTAAVEANIGLDDRAALRTPNDLAKARHVDIARSVLGNPARAGRSAGLRRRSRRFRLRLRLAIAIVILIAAQAVFAVAHS